jgi:excisionase family DNA binding protein
MKRIERPGAGLMDLPGPLRRNSAARSSAQDHLLTAAQVAARWQVPTSQVYRLTRCGQLTAVRIGRYYRYRLAAIEAWEQEGGSDG